jgi:hypothetical protein
MTPSGIGPRGRDDSARASDGVGGGGRSPEDAPRQSHPPTRTDISGPLAGAAQLRADETHSRAAAARVIAGNAWTGTGRAVRSTVRALGAAGGAVAAGGRFVGIDRRKVLRGAGAALLVGAGLEACHEIARLLEPAPLAVPDDLEASAEEIAAARNAVFEAAQREADEIIARLQASSPRSRDIGVLERAKKADAQKLITALDHYWSTVPSKADSARSRRLRAQVALLRLRPENGESPPRTAARRDELKRTVETLRKVDWTCVSRPDGTISCSL